MKLIYMYIVFQIFTLDSNAQQNIKVHYLTSLDTAYIETMGELGGITTLKKVPPLPGKYFVFLHGSNRIILEFMVDSTKTLCGEKIMYPFVGPSSNFYYFKYCDCDFIEIHNRCNEEQVKGNISK